MSERNRVFLIGFSGCGKSTVGPLLARQCHAGFIDTDQVIERMAGMNIADIFARESQLCFRRLESEVINSILSRQQENLVVALGGGAFQLKANRTQLLNAGTVVYLSCAAREIYRRMKQLRDRPLLHQKSGTRLSDREFLLGRINSLLSQRVKYYQLADIQVSVTSRTPRQVANSIARRLN